jgi:superfamily II DNA/RNA helicase
LRVEDVTTAIIFCNRKTTVRELATSLKRSSFAVGQIHGDMEQAARIAELDRFKAGEINILVASDVAARGLDIKGVSHVFNFDVPWQPDDYVHRIGRTGRAGAKGKAITLATREDSEAVAQIEKLTGTPIQRSGADPSAPASEEAASEESGSESKGRSRSRSDRQAAGTSSGRAGKKRVAAVAIDKGSASEQSITVPESDSLDLQEVGRKPTKPARSPARKDRDREEGVDREPAPAAPATRTAEPSDEDGWNGPLPSFLFVSLGNRTSRALARLDAR